MVRALPCQGRGRGFESPWSRIRKPNMLKSNKDIAHLLRSVAASYLLSKKNRFRIIAYEQAADAVEHLNREVYDLWQNNELDSISGIGATLTGHLDEYFKMKGNNDCYLVKQINKYPLSIYEMMKVPGIGAKRAYVFAKKINIEDSKSAIDDLLQAAQNEKISTLEKFGKKSERAIIEAIQVYRQSVSEPPRMPLPYAHRLSEEIIAYLKKSRFVDRVEALGSLRRRVATIGDIDLAVVCNSEASQRVI